jgi:hypothetical protein
MRSKGMVVLAALFGAVGGLAVTAVRVGACVLPATEWNVTRASATASDQSTTDEALWPAKGRLIAVRGHVLLDLTDNSAEAFVEASK